MTVAYFGSTPKSGICLSPGAMFGLSVKMAQNPNSATSGSEVQLGRSFVAPQENVMAALLSLPRLRLLQGAACIVIILWGIKTASHLVGVVLLGFLIASVFLPLPEWLMQRFKLGKNTAIGLALASMLTLCLVMVFYLFERLSNLREKLPIYQENFGGLYERVLAFLSGHGIQIATPLSTKFFELARMFLPEAGRVFADGLLISALGFIFLIVMLEHPEAKRSSLKERIHSHSDDVRLYIALSAKSSAFAALANLVVLLALGVDFPLVWCVLYFFLRFLPNLGFIIALLPPTLLALLTYGWQRALLVAGCLILTNLLTDLVLTPIFMKKGVDVSFVEITLSLMFWGTLLGPAGAILGIPLTLAIRNIIEEQSHGEGFARLAE